MTETERAGHWRLKKSVHSGGGPFELEERLTFSVYDVRDGSLVLEFEGGHDADYGGAGWKHTGSSGVVAAVLEADALITESAGGKKTRYALPRVQLEEDYLGRLVAAYAVYKQARGKYEYEEAWSSEVSIPSEAIEASYREIRPCWEALCAVMEEIGLRGLCNHDLIWPKHVPGGRERADALRKWIRRDGHRENGMRRYHESPIQK